MQFHNKISLNWTVKSIFISVKSVAWSQRKHYDIVSSSEKAKRIVVTRCVGCHRSSDVCGTVSSLWVALRVSWTVLYWCLLAVWLSVSGVLCLADHWSHDSRSQWWCWVGDVIHDVIQPRRVPLAVRTWPVRQPAGLSVSLSVCLSVCLSYLRNKECDVVYVWQCSLASKRHTECACVSQCSLASKRHTECACVWRCSKVTWTRSQWSTHTSMNRSSRVSLSFTPSTGINIPAWESSSSDVKVTLARTAAPVTINKLNSQRFNENYKLILTSITNR